MSFQDDVDDDPIVFTRPATCVVFRGPDGEELACIDTPEISLRRSEADPQWLALHDAEQKEQAQ